MSPYPENHEARRIARFSYVVFSCKPEDKNDLQDLLDYHLTNDHKRVLGCYKGKVEISWIVNL